MTEPVRARILAVDDERPLLEALVQALESMGYEVRGEDNPAQALALAGSWEPDVVIVDQQMPKLDGLELTRKIHEIDPELPVIMLTGYGSIQNAVQAMRESVYDYLTKPFDLAEVEMTIRRALSFQQQQKKYRSLAQATGRETELQGIVGESAAIRKVHEAILAVAATDSTVLVTGESGTGKELVARAIHGAGPRQERPFMVVDCSAIPDNLLESELFGHARGSFTGAFKEKTGYFEAVADGTIFLDEIGEIPLPLQAKLLRVLEEKSFVRVGDTRRRRAEGRVVAATNRDLAEEVEAGCFRKDLFYRLNVVEIHLPPLRERSSDVPLLLEHYLKHLNRRLNRSTAGISPAAIELLKAYSWPGNIRELVHLLEQVLTFHAPPEVEPRHLPPHIQTQRSIPLPRMTYEELKDDLLEENGRIYFTTLLEHYHGSVTLVAKHSGLNRRHIHRLLTKWGIDPARFRGS
jgi:DNA-binding NtrC family response regulator